MIPVKIYDKLKELLHLVHKHPRSSWTVIRAQRLFTHSTEHCWKHLHTTYVRLLNHLTLTLGTVSHAIHFIYFITAFSNYKQLFKLIRLTLHLNQELCLNTASSLALVLTPWATQGVDLINEDDRRLVLPCKVKQILHQPGKQKQKFKKLNSNMLQTYFYAFCGLLLIWLTFHSLPAIWRQDQTRRWRRRLSCLPLWRQL